MLTIEWITLGNWQWVTAAIGHRIRLPCLITRYQFLF
jgi:hypothetical protein